MEKCIEHRENSGKTQGISSQLEHGHPETLLVFHSTFPNLELFDMPSATSDQTLNFLFVYIGGFMSNYHVL